MESPQHSTWYILLFFIGALIHPVHCSGFLGDAEVHKRQPVERSSNTSFYGGVALWATITTSAYQCTAGSNMCSGGYNTCCPQGTFCKGLEDGYCCPLDVDCSALVNAAPACADSSWGLYEITEGSEREFLCCAPNAFALSSGGCMLDSATASGAASLYSAATSIAQAHGTPTAQGSVTATGSSTATITGASSTPSNGSVSKALPGGSTAAVILALLFGAFV